MRITVPATSANLGPGFDCLGLSIALYNHVTITRSKFNSINLKGEGSKNPKLKDNNMFINIFNDFYRTLTDTKDFFRFEFANDIPLSRGLGSSSAVITSAIASAYKVANIPIPKNKLLNLALSYENHPDNITPAIIGGMNVCAIDNNEVVFLTKKINSDLKAIIVIPNRPTSTQASRKTLPFKYSREDVIFNVSHGSLLTAAFFSESWDYLKIASKDRMHEFYRMKNMPELFEVQKIALQNGALMSTLSGSGSSFFNVVHTQDAKIFQAKLQHHFPHFRVLCCNFDNDGLRTED